ncbi:MAG: SPOR domain-containing protein [Gemmatimonadota bacterium]|nr:SPOR domain-containing protein [Gemmatimonadota bacterium]
MTTSPDVNPNGLEPSTPQPGTGVAWTPFDPADAPSLPAAERADGRVVVVVASTELARSDWAVSVTAELARTWLDDQATPRIVLVDTSLARPRLHHTLGVHNTPGLAEIMAGAETVDAATRTVEPGRLFCVPAGIAPEDPAAAFHRERWMRFCRAFAEAGVTIVAYVAADVPWLGNVLSPATEVVELREQHGSRTWPLPPDVPVLAVLGPMALPRPDPDPTGHQPAGSAPLLGFDASGPASDEAEGAEAQHAPEGRKRRRPRGRTVMTAALIVVAVAATSWLSLRPDVDASAPDPTGADEEAAVAEAATAFDAPHPIAPMADFSVALAAYRDSARASAHLDELAELAPDVARFIAPVEVDGIVYHRVLAGLAPDSASATALASELASVVGGDAASWIVRSTHLVFDLGGASTRDEATRELARVRDRGVPARLARVTYTDRSVRYRIYAGGYADPAEASHLGRLIASRDLEAELTTRQGWPLR